MAAHRSGSARRDPGRVPEPAGRQPEPAGRRGRGQPGRRRVRQVAGRRQRLVVLERVHADDPGPERLPEQIDHRRRLLVGVGGRGDDHQPVGEQVGPGVGGPLLLGPGQRVAADERRGLRGHLAGQGTDDVPLGAAGVGDDRPGRRPRSPRPARPRRPGPPACRRPPGRPRDARRPGSVVNESIAPAATARARVRSSRPTPTTRRATPRAFAASPTDPPIRPTPTMVRVSRRMVPWGRGREGRGQL